MRKLQLEENPLEDQALMQELEKVDGIEKITAFDSVYMTATFFGRKWFYHEHFRLLSNLNLEQTEEKQADVMPLEQQITMIWLRKMEYWLQKI